MPAQKNHNGFPGPPKVLGSVANPANFAEIIPIFEEANVFVTGITKDSTGAALGNCTVYLFRTDGLAPSRPVIEANSVKPFGNPAAVPPSVSYVWTGVSDGSGNFSAGPLSRMSGSYFAAAWSSSGLVAGITLNSLVPA